MTYAFDIDELIRRFVPVWFRSLRNLSYTSAMASWCASIHQRFLGWREAVILPGYQYNGLLHSMEWMLNDAYDAVDRRIRITVYDQSPVMCHATEGDAVFVAHSDEGDVSGYSHLDEDAITEVYRYEFIVHVPVEIAAIPPRQMFERLDVYRFAGRRPAIRYHDAADATVGWSFYSAEPPFNQL